MSEKDFHALRGTASSFVEAAGMSGTVDHTIMGVVMMEDYTIR